MFSLFLDRGKKEEVPCEKRKFFAHNDEVFFKRLQKALPNCHIFPQISLLSIIEAHLENEKKRQAIEEKLFDHQIDFAIFNKDLELLYVVELEDESQAKNEADEFSTRHLLESAGIKSIRWSRSALPSFEQILRIVAPFSELDAPKAQTSTLTIGHLVLDEEQQKKSGLKQSVFTYSEHNNPNALSLTAIERLTPKKYILSEYPHIWHKICIFAGEPQYLKVYLESLFLQNRPMRRIGLPKHVANEVMAIQHENSRYTQVFENQAIWDPKFLHR